MRMDLVEWFGVADITDRLAAVEEALAGALETPSESMLSAARRVTLGGGKRLRPALVYACGQLGAPNETGCLLAATAVELLQVGSLVHDDLFERALVRRGVRTINVVEGEPHSILIGDYILARAGEVAARAGTDVAACIASTCERLCVGQIDETTSLFDLSRTVDDCLRSIDLKTGALYSCSSRLGGLVGGLHGADLVDVTEFGRLFGVAFQLVDDALDLIGDADKLGKAIGVDMPSGVFSYPVVLALRADDGRLREALSAGDWGAATTLVLKTDAVDATVEAAWEYARGAAALIAPAHALARFPGRYVGWAVRELVAA